MFTPRIKSSRMTLRSLPTLALAGWLGASLTGCGGSESTSVESPHAATAAVQCALAEDGGALRKAVRSVECRAQPCRVEVNDDGTGPSGAMVPVFINRIASVLPTVSGARVDQGNGSMATVLYLSR